MSYILDALRKAEAERELSRVPGISSHQQFANAVRRFPAKLWLIVVGALLLGMATTWLWVRHGVALEAQASEVAQEEVSPDASAVKAEAQQQAAPRPKKSPVPSPVRNSVQNADRAPKRVPVVNDKVPIPTVPSGVAVQTILPASDSNRPASQEPVVATDTVPPREAPPLREERGAVDVVAMIAAEAERGWPVPVRDGPEPAQPAPSVESSVTEAAVQAGEPEETLPPLLSTLPYRFQSTVPKIVINAQAYADEVEARFVIINMKKYHEGQRTQEGILVERIGKDHLVLSYQGQAFRMQR